MNENNINQNNFLNNGVNNNTVNNNGYQFNTNNTLGNIVNSPNVANNFQQNQMNQTNVANQNGNMPSQPPMPPQPPKDTQSPPVNPSNTMDETFKEPKKKHLGIIITILLLILIGATGAICYFVLNTPKKIFIANSQKLFSKATKITHIDQYNMEYWLDLDITNYLSNSNDLNSTQLSSLDIAKILKVINNTNIYGKIGYDQKQKKHSTLVSLSYQNKPLLNFQSLVDLQENGNIYILLKDLYFRPIKITPTEFDPYLPPLNTKTNDQLLTEQIDIANYQIISKSISRALEKVLNMATYEKKYLKYDHQYLKRISLLVDQELEKAFIKELLNDHQFLASYAKITDTSIDKIKYNFETDISNMIDYHLNVNLYFSVFKNKFIIFELYEGNQLLLGIHNKNNTYHYEIPAFCEGNITINKIDNQEMTIHMVLELYGEETKSVHRYTSPNISYQIVIDLKTKTDYKKSFDSFNIDEAISANKLSPEDMMTIFSKLLANNSIKEILTELTGSPDLNLDSLLTGSL